MKKLLLIAGLALLAFAGTAQARYYLPKKGYACKAGFVRKVVHVRRHRDGKLVRVRQVRCVSKPKATTAVPTTPAPTTPAPAQPISYSTHVDPTFTQDPTNPLAVTYAYDATAIANGVNLGAVDQLPAGVLNFYSPTSPGQTAGLICSLNVGGAITGGSCVVDYAVTGAYQVTTQYVPNAATAVTETDTETIAPYATNTIANTAIGTVGTGENWFLVGVDGSVLDPSGDSVAQNAPLTYTIKDATTQETVESFSQPADQFCAVLVTVNPNSTMTFSSDTCTLNAITVPTTDNYVVSAAFGGAPGYAPSISAAQVF